MKKKIGLLILNLLLLSLISAIAWDGWDSSVGEVVDSSTYDTDVAIKKEIN
ncbi:MAG: hypothetical protein H8D67_16770 [Deltaproteobacteria bacterium]|nr:hypothetical protein [Deltaproteobacteria bacterium]